MALESILRDRLIKLILAFVLTLFLGCGDGGGSQSSGKIATFGEAQYDAGYVFDE